MAIPRGNANAYRIHVEEWSADSPYLRAALECAVPGRAP